MDPEKQYMLQQMIRQGQNPLMQPQMMGGQAGFPQQQYYQQPSHQMQGASSQGQLGQHMQQPGGQPSGFQQNMGSQINPFFNGNPNAMFQPHQAAQIGASQNQQAAHPQQITPNQNQRPQNHPGMGASSSLQSQHAAAPQTQNFFGQMSGAPGGIQQSLPPQQAMLLGGMMQPSQVQLSSMINPSQQQQMTHQNFQNPSLGAGQLSGNPALAVYMKQIQEQQQQPSAGSGAQDHSQQKPNQNNQYNSLPNNGGNFQQNTSANDASSSHQLQSQQNQSQMPSGMHQSSNVHQNNFLNQLSQPLPGAGSNLGLNQTLNPSMQYLSQGGNFQSQLGQQSQPSGMGGPAGQAIGKQNQNQPVQTPQPVQKIPSAVVGQPGFGNLQQNQPPQMNQQQSFGQPSQSFNGIPNQPLQSQSNPPQPLNANRIGQQQQTPGNQLGTGIAASSISNDANSANNLMNVGNLNKMAEFCATNGEYQSAIEYYLKLTTIDPENGPAWTALGHCYLLIEDLQKSFNAYQHALYSLEDIKDPQLWYGIGILYEKFESYDHAISALIAVLKMSPNFYQKSEVLYKLGMIFAKTNQIEQAISYFQTSILTNTFTVKRKVDTLLKMGLLYEENKDYAQAQRSYEAALNHDESNYKIYQHLAQSYFLQGNINTAIEFVKKAEKKNKGHADTHYILGRCFMGLENTKDALENFQQAAYKNPGEAVYWATLAIFYYNNGNFTDAFDNIIKATTLNSQMSEIWYNLGVLYEKCKQPEEALIAYSKVLELDSEDSDAQKRILAIKNPYYATEQSKNNLSLPMKYPKFTLPNSLTILRKYKKQGGNRQGGPAETLQTPGSGQGNQPTLNMGGVQNALSQLTNSQAQTSGPLGPLGPLGGTGILGGINNQSPQTNQLINPMGQNQFQNQNQTPDQVSNNNDQQQQQTQQQFGLNSQILGQGLPQNQSQTNPSIIQGSNIFNQNNQQQLQSLGSTPQNNNNINNQANSQRQSPRNNQQQFQGQQTKVDEPLAQNQHQNQFGQLTNFGSNNQIQQQKLQENPSTPSASTIQANAGASSENFINKMSDIHSILKPGAVGGNSGSQLNSGNARAFTGLSSLSGPSALPQPNFNTQAPNNNFQQYASGTQGIINPYQSGSSPQNQQQQNASKSNQNQQVQGQLGINAANPTVQDSNTFNNTSTMQQAQINQQLNPQLQGQPQYQQATQQLPSQNSAQQQPSYYGHQLQSQQEALSHHSNNPENSHSNAGSAMAQPQPNQVKTNYNQILQSLPPSVNLNNMSREELLKLLEGQGDNQIQQQQLQQQPNIQQILQPSLNETSSDKQSNQNNQQQNFNPQQQFQQYAGPNEEQKSDEAQKLQQLSQIQSKQMQGSGGVALGLGQNIELNNMNNSSSQFYPVTAVSQVQQVQQNQDQQNEFQNQNNTSEVFNERLQASISQGASTNQQNFSNPQYQNILPQMSLHNQQPVFTPTVIQADSGSNDNKQIGNSIEYQRQFGALPQQQQQYQNMVPALEQCQPAQYQQQQQQDEAQVIKFQAEIAKDEQPLSGNNVVQDSNNNNQANQQVAQHTTSSVGEPTLELQEANKALEQNQQANQQQVSQDNDQQTAAQNIIPQTSTPVLQTANEHSANINAPTENQ